MVHFPSRRLPEVLRKHTPLALLLTGCAELLRKREPYNETHQFLQSRDSMMYPSEGQALSGCRAVSSCRLGRIERRIGQVDDRGRVVRLVERSNAHANGHFAELAGSAN
ncbi:hypothetical protein AS026_05340 [Rhizobium altiplani]|uniref:Uncharacterized protein n=1 Tax=Rhizobium altiplani TaxID=1864509 RepID=A0A120FLD5_9HYPH|nr:hypothetical protein AS026_05340 [Rhizobium altiplani]